MFEKLKPLDHGELNVPNRLKNIDAEIERNMKRIGQEEHERRQEVKSTNERKRKEAQKPYDDVMTEEDIKVFRKYLADKLAKRFREELGYSASLARECANADVKFKFQYKQAQVVKAWLEYKSK